MNINGINFSNPKGAFMVGVNSIGKSTIIKRIIEGVKKNKINIDGNEYDVLHIDSENILGELVDGVNSIEKKIKKSVLGEVNTTSPQPSNLFDPTVLSTYNTNTQLIASSKNETNVMNSGINIKYKTSVQTQNLVSLEMEVELNGVIYSLEKASSGVKMLVALLLKGLEASVGNQLILIDEIESFLHPEWISLVAKIITAIISSGDKVILATHSPILISRLLKDNFDMLSTVVRGSTPNDGTVLTINYADVIDKVRNVLNSRHAHFKGVTGVFSNNDADKYIKASFNQETSMALFWKDPLLVEGPTEKIYIEQAYNKDVVSAGGFFQFPIFAIVLDSLGSKAKFLMDRDSGNVQTYNDKVFRMLQNDFADSSSTQRFTVHRLVGNFDELLHGSSVPNYEKVPKAISALSTNPMDPNSELTTFETFIN